MANKLPLDKIASNLENIAQDLGSTGTQQAKYAWDRIADAVNYIAEAVGVELPDGKTSTKMNYVASVLANIADADISGGGGVTKLYELIDATLITGTLKIPTDVIDIGDGVYQNCKGITYVNIPNTVKTIGDHSFMSLGATGGGSFDFVSTGVRTVGYDAFGGATILKSLKLDNCTFIDHTGFAGCSNLESIILPAIESFGINESTGKSNTFAGDTKLSYIYLGPNFRSTGGGAFSGVPITCKVECGFAEGAVSGFPANGGWAGDVSNLDITYNVAEPTM